MFGDLYSTLWKNNYLLLKINVFLNPCILPKSHYILERALRNMGINIATKALNLNYKDWSKGLCNQQLWINKKIIFSWISLCSFYHSLEFRNISEIFNETVISITCFFLFFNLMIKAQNFFVKLSFFSQFLSSLKFSTAWNDYYKKKKKNKAKLAFMH